jgi:hypothetical protein
MIRLITRYELLTLYESLYSKIQTSYIFAPGGDHDIALPRPKKRRKLSKQHEAAPENSIKSNQLDFPALLNGNESPAFVELRQRLFEDSWATTEAKIQVLRACHVFCLF